MKLLYDLYFSIFDDEITEVRYTLDLTRKVDPEFRLFEGMRTILDLANHIAQIPRIDYGIYSGELSSGEIAHEMEEKLTRNSIDEILKVFDEGCQFLKKQFAEFTDEDFMKEEHLAFYEEDESLKPWTYYLPKIITHLVLHKGILWTYLRANLNVDMFSYYGKKFTTD